MPCCDLIKSLTYARIRPSNGPVSYMILKMLGKVICSRFKKSQRVKICSGTSLGQAGIDQPMADSKFAGVAANKRTLSTGWNFLFMGIGLKEKRGSDLGENVVVLGSTGDNEVCTGIPACNMGLCTP